MRFDLNPWFDASRHHVIHMCGLHPIPPNLCVFAYLRRLRLEIGGYISDERRAELLRSCSVALCCSSAEGFGHYIMEAARFGCLVVTTDGIRCCGPPHRLCFSGGQLAHLCALKCARRAGFPMSAFGSETIALAKPSSSSVQNFGRQFNVPSHNIVEAAVKLPLESYDRKVASAAVAFFHNQQSKFNEYFDRFFLPLLRRIEKRALDAPVCQTLTGKRPRDVDVIGDQAADVATKKPRSDVVATNSASDKVSRDPSVPMILDDHKDTAQAQVVRQDRNSLLLRTCSEFWCVDCTLQTNLTPVAAPVERPSPGVSRFTVVKRPKPWVVSAPDDVEPVAKRRIIITPSAGDGHQGISQGSSAADLEQAVAADAVARTDAKMPPLPSQE